MLAIAIALVLLIVFLYVTTRPSDKIYIRNCPPGVLFTYQKISGSSGKIYDLDISTDGTYMIYTIDNLKVLPTRQGVLDGRQLGAYKRLLYNPPRSCLGPKFVPTIADSMITQIIYRAPTGNRVVYLGPLDEHALPHDVYNDVVTLDKILNAVA